MSATTAAQRERTPLQQAEIDRFSRKLGALMNKKGMSQSDLARAIWGNEIDSRGRDTAKNRDRISHYIRGTQLPEPSTVKLLAKALGVRVEALSPSLVARNEQKELHYSEVAGTSQAVLFLHKTLAATTAREILALVAADEFASQT